MFVDDEVPGVPPGHVLDLLRRQRRGAVGHRAEHDEGVAAGGHPEQHSQREQQAQRPPAQVAETGRQVSGLAARVWVSG